MLSRQSQSWIGNALLFLEVQAVVLLGLDLHQEIRDHFDRVEHHESYPQLFLLGKRRVNPVFVEDLVSPLDFCLHFPQVCLFGIGQQVDEDRGLAVVLALVLVYLALKQFIFEDGEFFPFAEGFNPLPDVVGDFDVEGFGAAVGDNPLLDLVLLAVGQIRQLQSKRRLAIVFTFVVVKLSARVPPHQQTPHHHAQPQHHVPLPNSRSRQHQPQQR